VGVMPIQHRGAPVARSASKFSATVSYPNNMSAVVKVPSMMTFTSPASNTLLLLVSIVSVLLASFHKTSERL
jgi:uncharacterized membrane protein YesL